MHKTLLFLWLLIPALANAHSILPDNETFNSNTPMPEAELGWPVGEWHARPEQITRYFERLAEGSDRASLEVIGRTHEQRPLLQLMITSPENQARLEQLRQDHLQGEGPLVVWLGYSIHGNEASGSNAAMLTAYHLIAGEAQWVKDLLDNAVVIIDPMFNPDGLGRFATWANMHRGQQAAGDVLHRAHWEAWPAGRFNHYWFDMNRDWLPATQPESVARLTQFHRWLPNILGDFHEQGSDAGYFFQPGVPERKNPLTPDENVELTTELARFHGRALDAIGQRYYSRETFDDFYYGKGSTYPDINGSIGILYEQPSTRGHKVDSVNGEFTFTDAIRNHYATSISTLQGAYAIKDRLVDYQQRFYADSQQRARNGRGRAWVFADGGDAVRAKELAELMRLHQIEVYPLAEDIRVDDMNFSAGQAWVVPIRQRQAALIEAMFEQRTEFTDNTFYDVSAWTLPRAYNLPFAQINSLPERTADPSSVAVEFTPQANASAYLFSNHNLAGAAMAMHLLNEEIRVYRLNNTNREIAADSIIQRGDFVVPVLRGEDRAAIEQQLSEQSQRWQVPVKLISSGFNLNGVDLGSPDIQPLKAVKPLMIVGQGVVPMEAGHTWHLVDRRLGLPLPMLDVHHPAPPNLDDYTHLLIADASHDAVPKAWYPLIKGWVSRGGVLVTQKRSAEWAEAIFSERPKSAKKGVSEDDRIVKLIEQLAKEKDTSNKDIGRQSYSQHQFDSADRILGGAIFPAQLDLSHPLAQGYQREDMAVFLNSITKLEPSKNAYSTPLVLADSKPLAGFASEYANQALDGRPVMVVDKVGQGVVIKFAFNPNFRAFWRGTEGLYVNALLNSPLVQSTTLPAD